VSHLRLVFEIYAHRPEDARDLAGVIEDYAEEQFEELTILRGRPMTMTSRQEKPGKLARKPSNHIK
jgi:hypothetical protein